MNNAEHKRSEPESQAMTIGVEKERVDPYTLEVIEQLFPGHHGVKFLSAILRLATAKQMALPELSLLETTDVAVIAVQSLRKLSQLIDLSYETTEKYVVLFCRLRLLHKKRYRRQIVLSFPLSRCQLPEPKVLDGLDYRASVQSFASQVKRRLVQFCKSGRVEPPPLAVFHTEAQRLVSPPEERVLDTSTPPKQHHPRRNEARVIQFHNKRAEMVTLPATLTRAEWKMTLEYFGYKCADFQINDYQVFEHVIPLTSGGGTTRYNCVPACVSCNSAKGDQHPSMLPPSSWIATTLPHVQKYLKTRERAEGMDS